MVGESSRVNWTPIGVQFDAANYRSCLVHVSLGLKITMALPLAPEHELSTRLSSTAPAQKLPLHCSSVTPASAGVTSVTLSPPPCSPYGYREWPLRVGGYGIGNDADEAFGGPPRRPIMVRFHNVLLSCKGVDEGGVVSDETF